MTETNLIIQPGDRFKIRNLSYNGTPFIEGVARAVRAISNPTGHRQHWEVQFDDDPEGVRHERWVCCKDRVSE